MKSKPIEDIVMTEAKDNTVQKIVDNIKTVNPKSKAGKKGKKKSKQSKSASPTKSTEVSSDVEMDVE